VVEAFSAICAWHLLFQGCAAPWVVGDYFNRLPRPLDAIGWNSLLAPMEQYGNTSTYNLENVLLQNIKRSDYYTKQASNVDNWEDLVDEIYYRCVASSSRGTHVHCLWVTVQRATAQRASI
jgi:hypothetical protein